MPPSENDFDSKIKKNNQIYVQECINELKLLVMADPRMVVRSDDLYLLRYLHCTDFRVKEAYKKMKILNDVRLEHSDWFCSTPPTDHLSLMSWHMKAMLGGRDRQGRRIYLTKMANVDATKTTMVQLARFDDLWFESVLDEAETQANGMCCILDMAGYSWKMFKWLTPKNVRVANKCVEAMPIKRLMIHIVNSSMLLNAAVAVIFPFMSNRIKENIHFHYQNWSSLHKFVDPELLPQEYGGAKDVPNFEEMNQWLLRQSSRLEENFKLDKRI